MANSNEPVWLTRTPPDAPIPKYIEDPYSLFLRSRQQGASAEAGATATPPPLHNPGTDPVQNPIPGRFSTVCTPEQQSPGRSQFPHHSPIIGSKSLESYQRPKPYGVGIDLEPGQGAAATSKALGQSLTGTTSTQLPKTTSDEGTLRVTVSCPDIGHYWISNCDVIVG